MRTRICTCRRAVALMLAMIAVIVAGTVGYSYLAAQSTSMAIAQNIDDAARARYVAETGMEVALSYVKNTSNWRSVEPNGIWASSISFGGGTYSIRGEDGIDANNDGAISVPTEGDGSLTDDASDPATITVTSVAGGASYKVTSVASGGSGGTSDYGYKTVLPNSTDGLAWIQIATRVSITETGQLTSLSYYGNGPASKRYRLALYTDSGGPENLVAQTAAAAVGPGAATWHTLPVSGTPPTVTAGTYWIAISLEDVNMDCYYDFSSSGRLHITIANSVLGGFSSSWSWTLLAIPGRLNLYATVGSNTLSLDWKN